MHTSCNPFLTSPQVNVTRNTLKLAANSKPAPLGGPVSLIAFGEQINGPD